MKTHTSNFKEEIKLLGKQQDVRITYTINDEQIVLSSEDINSATPNYEASLLKSVMKGLDLDSNVDIPLGTEIKFEYGLLVNGVYEYLNYGNYIVYSSEKQEDTLSYKITCYDKMLYSMKDYEHIEVTYPITIYEYLKAVCNKIGLQMKETNFANMLRQVPSELFMTINEDGTYSSMGYTYRDVLDQIAETTGGCICMTLDDKVEVRYINETNDTIDEEYINDTNVNFGEKYGPINSIVLARAGESDKIYKKDQNSIDNNGLCELMIKENQFMNFNDRSDYLQELSDKLFGVEYYLNDFVSTGIMYYDLLDMYGVKIYGKTYNCLMLNDEQDITQGLEENIHTDRPEKSETDYSKADKTDRRINKTTLIVDKQNQEINGLIEKTTDQGKQIANINVTVEGINSTISDYDETKERVNQIEQTVEGWSQKLSTTGGNNIFKYAKEFWQGETEKDKANLEEYTDTDLQQNSISGIGYIVNKGTSKQKIQVKNDNYVISFKYKKLVELAIGYILLNGTQYDLTATEWTEMVITENIDTSEVDFEIISDTDNAFKICDLMGSIGTEKQVWTQNPNETRTDTVKIGKGIQVNSNVMNTYTRIDADGNRTFNSATGEVVMEATDKGVKSKEVIANVAQIGGILVQEIDGQTWISSLL